MCNIYANFHNYRVIVTIYTFKVKFITAHSCWNIWDINAKFVLKFTDENFISFVLKYLRIINSSTKFVADWNVGNYIELKILNYTYELF
jgi:hypothetical protein